MGVLFYQQQGGATLVDAAMISKISFTSSGARLQRWLVSSMTRLAIKRADHQHLLFAAACCQVRCGALSAGKRWKTFRTRMPDDLCGLLPRLRFSSTVIKYLPGTCTMPWHHLEGFIGRVALVRSRRRGSAPHRNRME
jgi:hypothetical protein